MQVHSFKLLFASVKSVKTVCHKHLAKHTGNVSLKHGDTSTKDSEDLREFHLVKLEAVGGVYTMSQLK